MGKQAVISAILLFSAINLYGQICLNTGQTPSSAIPLCGAESFTQSLVPLCGRLTIPVPCAAATVYQNTNPTWFRLSCYSSGTLGFIITPDDTLDNYDWQLFDITGRNDDDVFADPTLFVSCNWCPDPGQTGTMANANYSFVCEGITQELFCTMPNIIQGREYLLLVSHRNSSESGFQILITDGTAIVTDPAGPVLSNARLGCSSNEIIAVLNKKMICSTVAPDGSDFLLSTGATITSAVVSNCINGGGSLVTLSLSNPMTPGTYTLSIQTGTDGNTISDKCNRYIPSGITVPLNMPSSQPARMDSLKTPGCSPSTLQLFFRKPVRCSSVALNGSDFIITGQQPVTINNITISCNTQTTTTSLIELQLSSPITTGGNYQIELTTGSDGNTLIDECGGPVPAGVLPFTIKSGVSALFNYTIKASCREDTIYFSNINPGGITDWNWSFDNILANNSPTQVKIYPATSQHTVRLIVSNGTCRDTAAKNIRLDNKVIAAFEAPDIICPEDTVHFFNTSTGTVDEWKWSFGNGITSNLHSPPSQRYPITNRETIYTAKLVASNIAMNCRDSVLHKVMVLSGCYIAVPTAFTPNGDGLNDYLFPANALKAGNLVFKVYNQFGQLVFQTMDWTRKWDGKINGQPQHSGVYAWMLSYTHHDTGEKVFMKGTTVLIR